jgi:hypothetical protein
MSGAAGTLAQGIGRRGNAAAAAQGLAQAVDRGQGDAAAQAVAGAAASGGDSVAIGEAVAEATRRQPRVAPYVLRRSADLAVNSGHTQGFARSMSNAFVYAQRNRCVQTAAAAVVEHVCAFPVPQCCSPASTSPAATVAHVWVCLYNSVVLISWLHVPVSSCAITLDVKPCRTSENAPAAVSLLDS